MNQNQQCAARPENDNRIPYTSAYFGCCNRTVMTRADIAQPKFCPFCGKCLAHAPSPTDAVATQAASGSVCEKPSESAASERPVESAPQDGALAVEQFGKRLRDAAYEEMKFNDKSPRMKAYYELSTEMGIIAREMREEK